jgi:hypothetical protein
MSVRAPGGGGTAGTVDLCEDNVLSTIWPKSAMGSCYRGQGIKGYETLAGTSMAAPHVAGLAGLLAAAGLSAQEIVDRIRATAALPFGIVDADAATQGLPVPAPAPPPSASPPSRRPAPSASDRRCTQARATLRLRDRALKNARRRMHRARGRAARRRAARTVTRRAAERRRAARDVARRCG